MLKYSIFLSLFHTEKDMDLVSVLKRKGYSLTSYVKVGNHDIYLVPVDNLYFLYQREKMPIPYAVFAIGVFLFVSVALYYLSFFKKAKSR